MSHVPLPSAYQADPPSLSIHALDQAISRIEEDIRAKFEQLCNLKRQRNARIPVARLPPEILADIFVYLRDACIEIPEREASFLTDQRWLSVLLVSCAWRETALVTPRLWTCIDLLKDKAVFEFIARAGALPLELFVCSKKDTSVLPTSEVFNAARKHPGKICALTISALDNDILRTCLSSLIPSAADTLHILEICCLDSIYFILPDAVHTLSLPELEKLTITGCDFDFGCTMLSGCAKSLQSLVVTQCKTHFDGSPQRHYLDVLGTLQTLEYLCIERSLDGWQYPDDLPKLHLPSLKGLYLHEYEHAPVVFLSMLRIPDTCYADISMDEFNISPERSPDVAGFFLPVPYPLHLSICRATSTVSVHTINRTLTLTVPTGNSLLKIGMHISAHARHLCLYIDYSTLSAPSLLQALCGDADAVAVELNVQGTSAALATIAECLADTAGFLPRLARVVFTDFDMSTVDGGDLDKLVEALLQRRKAGAWLDVNFEECRGVSKALLEKLEEHL